MFMESSHRVLLVTVTNKDLVLWRFLTEPLDGEAFLVSVRTALAG